MTVNAELDELFSILHREMGLYQDLIGLLQQEKEIIVTRFSLEELHTCNNQKETILLKLNVLERARVGLLENLARLLNVSVEGLTLSGLARLAEEPYRPMLETCRAKMVSIAESLREISQINRILVERSLDSIRSFFSLLNLLGLCPQIYLPSGQIGSKNGQGALLSRTG